MIAIKAIIIKTISINLLVNSTKFGYKTKLNQNLEQIPEEIKFCQENRYHVSQEHSWMEMEGLFFKSMK